MKIKNLKTKIVVTLVVLAFTLVTYFTSMPCIILDLTGKECLGCGMTRALISALQFKFAQAFTYHLMFWSVPILYLCFLLDGKLFKSKILNICFYVIIAIGFLINWLI